MQIIIKDICQLDQDSLGITLDINGVKDADKLAATVAAYKALQGQQIQLWQILLLLYAIWGKLS